jgi:hypothetical protein
MVQIYHNTTEFPNQPPNGFTDLCTLSPCPVSRSIFNYAPSLSYNLILLAAFGFCCVCHVYVAAKYRTWGYGVAMVLGCQSTSALAAFYKDSGPKLLVLQLKLSVTLGVAWRTATLSKWCDLHVICLPLSVLTPYLGYLPLANNHPHHRPCLLLRRHLPLPRPYCSCLLRVTLSAQP